MQERNGKPLAELMTPEEFRRAFNADFVEKGFVETEIGPGSSGSAMCGVG